MQWVRAAAAAVFAVTLALPAAAGAAPLYHLLDLGTLNPAVPGTSWANDVNELGQVVGASIDTNGRLEAFRTAPNAPINPTTDGLGYFDGGQRLSEATAINDQGQVVGVVQAPGTNNGFRAFVTGPNQQIVSHMGSFSGGTNSFAAGINNAGQVAGYSQFGPSPTDPTEPIEHAFRTAFSRALTDSDDLGTLSGGPGGGSAARGLNDRGEVVGVSINNAGRREAFRTAPNAPTNPATDGLGTLGGDSFANAINRSGQVVGDSDLLGPGIPGLRRHAFRTAPGAAINPLTDDLGTLGGARSQATDVNDFGVVVGSSTGVADPPGGFAPDHAFVYMDGQGMFDLNNLIANRLPAGWTLEQAEGINNKGQIVGYARVPPVPGGAATRAFLLTPVPEPRLVTLHLSLAFLAAARTTRRRAARPKL